jgi:hypothetical protein
LEEDTVPRVVIALLAVVVAVPVALAHPRHADACSVAAFASAAERLEQQTAWSELIVVGTVAEEVLTGHVGANPAVPSYASTIDVGAALLGPTVDRVRLAPLGWLGADCEGGPRMRQGERVLLFLRATENGSGWEVALVGQGKYRLVDGEALFERSYSGEPAPEAEAAGPADVLIREVGRMVGAPPDEVERAVRFALAAEPSGAQWPGLPLAAEQSDAQWPGLPLAAEQSGVQWPGPALVVALIAALVLACAGLSWRLMRRRSSAGQTST